MAPEAYLGDVVRPLKRLIGDVYTIAEARVMYAIDAAFARETQPNPILRYCDDPAVKRADAIALATERRDFMEKPPLPWTAWESSAPSAGSTSGLPTGPS